MIKKYTNHLVFLVLLALLFIGAGAASLTTTALSDTDSETEEGIDIASVINLAGDEETESADNTNTNTVNITPIPTVRLDNVPVLSDDSFAPDLNPVIDVGGQPSHSFQTHIVDRGDAPQNIADRYGIQVETILGGNPNLSNEAGALQTGLELIILPVDGVLHTVSFGETLESVSIRYGIPQEDIIAYADNNLEFPYRLHPDTQLIIPGAQPEAGFVWNPPSLADVSNTNCAPEIGGGCNFYVNGTGFHVWPLNSRRLTQGYWIGHQAYDVGVPEGTAIIATDTGTVTYAAWSPYCYGNLVVVHHGNTGHETFYAHLSSIAVGVGQIVEKGQYLGASGNTGCSSGPHLHYEIRIWGNRDNPAYYLP